MKQYITSITQNQKPDEDMTALFISKCVWTKLVTLALSQSGIMLSSTRFLMMRSSYSIKMVVNQDKNTVYRVSFNHQFELFFCDILHSLTAPISVILSWATSPSGGSWPSVMDQTVMHFFIFRQKLCEIEITMPLQRFTPSGSYSGKCGTAKKPLTISKVKRWRFFLSCVEGGHRPDLTGITTQTSAMWIGLISGCWKKTSSERSSLADCKSTIGEILASQK